MDVMFHVVRRKCKFELSDERVSDVLFKGHVPDPYRLLIMDTDEGTVNVFLSSEQALELCEVIHSALISGRAEKPPVVEVAV